MKKLLSAAIASLMLLSLTACGSSGQTDNSGSSPSQTAAAETAEPETNETVDTEKDFEPVTVNEVVYDDNGIKITYIDYRQIPEDDLEEGGFAVKANFRIEKTADHVEYSPVCTTANGYLTSDSLNMTLNPSEIPAEGADISVRIRRVIMEAYGFTDVSEIGLVFAVKADDHFVYDHIDVPVFSGKQDRPVESKTEGFYQPGVLVNITNNTAQNMVAFYLVKCKDGEGHQLLLENMNLPGEWLDGRFDSVKIKGGVSDFPAGVRIAANNDWEYEGNYFHDYEIADATAELICVYPDVYNEDVSDQITITEVVRKDSHLYGYIEWPEDLGKLEVYGTVMRYQNGELKSVVSASSNNMDPAKDENFLYFENYDHNYDNETFEMVITEAVKRPD